MPKRILSALILMSAPLLAQQGNRKGHDNMDPVVPKELIPPAPVLTVDEAMKSFEIAEGFEMIAAIARNPNLANGTPAAQLARSIAGAPFADGKRLGEVIQRERPC